MDKGIHEMMQKPFSKYGIYSKSFTVGLTVQEFDNDIYDKEIAKSYDKYEIQPLSKIKNNRERSIGADRPFKP